MIAVIAVVVGVFLGYYMPYNLTSEASPFMAIAIVAAMDSVFGGVTAHLNHKFDIKIFFVGMVSNAALATFMTFIGRKLGVDLSLAVVVVFGSRMFQNFVAMRYILMQKYENMRQMKKDARELVKSEKK